MTVTWFGNTTETSNVGFSGDTPWGAAFTAPATGNITSGHLKITSFGPSPPTHVSKFLVYADSGGNPGALLGASDELLITGATSLAVRTYTFSVPVAVVSGTSYFLCGFAGPSDMTWRYRSQSGGARVRSTPATYGSGPPNPFGTASSSNFQPYIEAGIDDAPLTAGVVPRIVIT